MPVWVSEFIDVSSATWREEKLCQHMLSLDVEVILQIPLSTRQQEDFWAWHYDRHGRFSIRSAYKMLVSTRDWREAWLESREGSSNTGEVEKEWSELWHTKVPSKIRVFLWRLAKQLLPTNDVRYHIKMAENDRYQLYGAQDSWRHALLNCAMSHSVWALVDEEVTEHMQNAEEGRAREWLATMISTLEEENPTRILVTLWAIWHARRKAIHEQIYQSPLSIHSFVESFLADLNQGTEGERRRRGVRAVEALAWIPPPQGMLKVNINAATSKNTGRGVVAAVARDDRGRFEGASAVIFPGNTEAETLEALACREVVALARDINARRIRVASDCQQVIGSLENGTMGAYAHIVQEINESRGDFKVLSFIHE
jgi:hypothetical protein